MFFLVPDKMEVINKVAIIPGNGAGDVYKANWYGWLHSKLNVNPNITCLLENMPDPVVARESIWIPFMRNELAVNEKTLIVGHSSGACAALRFAEKYKVGGIVLVGAYISDLGDENEKASGYFNRPWQWDIIKSNSRLIIQFASKDDPFLPWEEQEQVSKNLGAECFTYEDKGHFMSFSFPELLDVINNCIKFSTYFTICCYYLEK